MGETLSMGFQPSMPDDRTTDQEHKKMRTRILDELKKSFRPEFLNRLDAVVVFKRLTPPEMRQIVDLMVVRIGKHLADQDLKLEISDKAKDKIAEEGFDKVYGARPMRRVIQRVIEDPLSEELLRFRYKAGDTVLVDVGTGGEIELGQVSGKPAKPVKEPKESGPTAKAVVEPAATTPAAPPVPTAKPDPEP